MASSTQRFPQLSTTTSVYLNKVVGGGNTFVNNYASSSTLFAWGGSALQKKFAAGDDKPRYKTAEVDRGSIVQFVTATGTLNPVALVNVGTQVSGTVSELNVDFNDRVKRGQVLLKIDPTLLITHRFKFDQMLEAYETFGNAAKTHALKVIIEA